MPPSRRLAIFFDGTDNTPRDRTNVWRTHELLADRDAAGVPQLRWYLEGVGTEFGSLATGSIFGVGVSKRIREAYAWLVEHYVDDAEIYVFGFSRGAFTARSFVQFIATCGLTRPETLAAWPTERSFARYEAIGRQATEEIHPIWRLRHWAAQPSDRPAGWSPSREDAILLDDARVRVVKVRMAGLWDTVGALGADALANRVAVTQRAATHNVRPTRAQEYGYHALAIDEHRPMFEVTLWRVFIPETGAPDKMATYRQYYEQRWFVGAHADVGGGYGEDALPDLSLQWMLGKAAALGLAFTHAIEPAPGAWHAPVHHSFEAFAGGVLSLWDKFMPGDQRHYREMGKAPRQVGTVEGAEGLLWSINEAVDDSVVRRWTENPSYRPPNLVDYYRRHPEQIPQGTSLAQRTERVYANRYWNDTGVYLRPRTRYRARVTPGLGEPLRDKYHLSRSIAGEDWDSLEHKAAEMFHGKRNDAARWFALVATIDKKQPWVLVDGAEFTVGDVGGKLFCYFNDVELERFYGNNSGWVALDIEQI